MIYYTDTGGRDGWMVEVARKFFQYKIQNKFKEVEQMETKLIRIDANLHERLRVFAFNKRQSMSDVTRGAIDSYITKKEKQDGKTIGNTDRA